MPSNKPIALAAYLVGTGMHIASWRQEHAQADASISLDFYKHLARTAEQGRFDVVFLADSLAINEASHPNILNRFEPITLVSALAGATERIGLVATASTSYSEPFNLARLVMSADHISGGRVGWNIVTTRDLSGNTARNFSGTDHYALDLRYRRAAEFVKVVQGLWDSWEDDAFVRDKASGRFFDPAKLHRLAHQGEFFGVEGPLNISRSPQGHPVLVQAGVSAEGQAFAAGAAEVIFVIHKNLETAQAFYTGFRAQVAAAGRNPDDVRILQGISPFIAVTDQEAYARLHRLEALITRDQAVHFLTDYFGGHDFSQLDLSARAADLGLHQSTTARADFRRFRARVEEHNPTLQELYSMLTGSMELDDFIGSPTKIAASLERWVDHQGADGFILMAPSAPDGLEEFVDQIVPLLQSRGRLRTEYTGHTLREHLRLPKPVHRLSPTQAATGTRAAGPTISIPTPPTKESA